MTLHSTRPRFSCGCNDCTLEILGTDAGDGATCFDRIEDRRIALDITEEDACRIVSDDLPRTCGPMCNPSKCDGKAPAHCSCEECTPFVLDLKVDGFSCMERIKSVEAEQDFNEDDACRAVSNAHPTICGPQCHPGTKCRLMNRIKLQLPLTHCFFFWSIHAALLA